MRLGVLGREFTMRQRQGVQAHKGHMGRYRRFQKTLHVEEEVVERGEPSFGIGRIMCTIFEHIPVRRCRRCMTLAQLAAPSKNNILQAWRQHFIRRQILEMLHHADPEPVLK
ncbi:glycine--tRNA ligase isoform X1 [Lates japonicus]|uniref:Glycine--tRNA ligase isoform X1 n=1 Tax=Lates japonicus TaxID=270547 RepID=A0AAD3R3L7_LATJO|nr:glycine--tRNA ligase isoform X1 [Lates japonicus]